MVSDNANDAASTQGLGKEAPDMSELVFAVSAHAQHRRKHNHQECHNINLHELVDRGEQLSQLEAEVLVKAALVRIHEFLRY